MQKTVKTKKKKRRISKKLVGKVICIVLLIFAIAIFAGVGKETVNVIHLKKQEATVKEQLAILEQENSDLLATKNKLEDPNYVTTYARGEYMFSKGDEKLFRLPSKGE